MDYRRLNQQLVRDLYCLHIMGETMQKLIFFLYEDALDLNISYYKIITLHKSGYDNNCC